MRLRIHEAARAGVIDYIGQPTPETNGSPFLRIVKRHRVFFEVVPAKEWAEDGIVCIGYDLHIYGTHEEGSRGALPGCARCTEVWRELRDLGESVIPADLSRASRYHTRPFDSALRSSSVTDRKDRNREDVLLVIEIRHKRQFFAPVDPCEERCLKEMVIKLKAFGAKEGRWTAEQ